VIVIINNFKVNVKLIHINQLITWYKRNMAKRLKLTKNLYLKEVQLTDTNYILKLRTDKNLSKYLNKTKNSKIDQKKWLKDYLIRRKEKKEFYFIFQLKNKKNLGFARIIYLKKNLFHFGGWILEKNKKPWISLECCLAIYEYGFNILKYKNCLLWIHLKNIDVINYHKSLGAKFVKRTKKEIFFNFSKNNYIKLKKKFKYFYHY
jgi:RimJ/RimL family protein N-acetyltransferase